MPESDREFKAGRAVDVQVVVRNSSASSTPSAVDLAKAAVLERSSGTTLTFPAPADFVSLLNASNNRSAFPNGNGYLLRWLFLNKSAGSITLDGTGDYSAFGTVAVPAGEARLVILDIDGPTHYNLIIR